MLSKHFSQSLHKDALGWLADLRVHQRAAAGSALLSCNFVHAVTFSFSNLQVDTDNTSNKSVHPTRNSLTRQYMIQIKLTRYVQHLLKLECVTAQINRIDDKTRSQPVSDRLLL